LEFKKKIKTKLNNININIVCLYLQIKLKPLKNPLKNLERYKVRRANLREDKPPESGGNRDSEFLPLDDEEPEQHQGPGRPADLDVTCEYPLETEGALSQVLVDL